jgi:rubrerythrin
MPNYDRNKLYEIYKRSVVEKKKLNEIVEINPEKIKSLSPEAANLQMLRFAMIAELDAVNIYEQFADITNNEKIKKVMLDVANEEKVHVGEFKKIMKEIDPEYEDLESEGEEEVEEI